MLGNISPPVLPAQTSFTISVGPPIYNMWAPTTRNRTDLEHGPADRNSDRCFFVGWKDRIYINLGDAPLIWRRTLFWSYRQDPIALSPTDVGTGDYYRRTQPFTYASDAALVESFYKGTVNRDWHVDFAYDAKFDNHRKKVIYDKKIVINPKAAAGVRNMRPWYPIRRWIQYDDEEVGSDTISSPWAATAPNNPGNLYCLDTFALPVTYGTQPVVVRMESTVYWREI